MSNPQTTENYMTTNEELEAMYREIFSSGPKNSFPFYPPLRKMRADRITAEVMQIIWKHLRDNHQAMEENKMRDIHRDILDMFFKADVDFVTEIDRINAGLERRTAYGLTREEMQIMELERKRKMLEPLTAKIGTVS